ncbi:MAG: hypothetical protein CMI63_03810 [Parvularcula sp.]|jgi:hypothetical protein|uniref:hypothetical protein n=1 Tax=Hyphococcus sp. TaxID=2038636 RepID=UPI000C428BBE|nr:hypothetical protein [Parvularcula sp.]
MKRIIVSGAAAASLFGVALASESEAACEEFAANNGVSAEPCACVADAVSGDPDLQAEQLSLVTMEDYENSSAELQAAIDPCLDE